MVPVGVADQVVKDGRVDDVEQARTRVVRGRFLHGVAVALVILPPAAREEPSSPSGNHHCTATAATAALSHLRVHQERRAAQARQRRKSLTTVFHEKSKLCINIPAYGASCSFSSKIHQNQLLMESRVHPPNSTVARLCYGKITAMPSASQEHFSTVFVSTAWSCFQLAFQPSSSFFLSTANILIVASNEPLCPQEKGFTVFTLLHSQLFLS